MPIRPSSLLAQTRLCFQPLDLHTRTHWSKMAAAPPPKRPIKILMLHGYTQSGPLFQAKTGALRKTLQKAFPAGIELVYPTAPIRLTPADESWLAGTSRDAAADGSGGAENQEQELDAWAWWKRKSLGDQGGYVYDGIEGCFEALASVLRKSGPFDGVVGFSQGGAVAAMLASVLEPRRREAFEKKIESGGMPFPAAFIPTADTVSAIHPPLKFAVVYSGFLPQGASPYAAFYDPKIQTPVLHFLGSQDVVVEEKRSLALVEACEKSGERYVVYHPGGHFLPSTQKASVNALVGFIKEVLWEGEAKGEDEGVEGMDVPF